MIEIRAVLFDLGGTLVDYRADSEWPALGRVTRVIYDSFIERGYELPSFGRFKRRVLWTMAWGRLSAKLRKRETDAQELAVKAALSMNDTVTPEDLRHAARAGFAGEMSESKFIPGALEALRFCRDAGYVMGIVSNTVLPEWIIVEDLERRGIASFFDFMIFSSSHGRRKPHHDIFDHALAEAGVPAKNIVFVGDRFDADIIGAARAGMHTVWINPDGKPVPDRPRADAVIRTLEEFTEAVSSLRSGEDTSGHNRD